MSSNVIKRIIEYIIIIILCAIISSLVFAYEFQDFQGAIEQQMILNQELVDAIEILALRIEEMKTMRGI